MVSGGMPERDVLELPLDKFFAYIDAENRRRDYTRKQTVLDTAGAIGGVFGEKGSLKKYISSISGDQERG